MEKTTKKSKKKSRRLKKRIGIIAVGGLSFVLTICLSVGATLAWFAGSSWASNDLYMGGPVYVEMAGRGASEGTEGEVDENGNQVKAKWVGGSGNLDIKAASKRLSGSIIGGDTETKIPDNIMLPGQKVQIYSQARVYSTAETDTVEDNPQADHSSGANNTNTTNATGTAQYVDSKGRKTTTTTSVLRARFSISIEFDPSVGFNNFTNEDYMAGYPVQSDKGLTVDEGKEWYEAAKPAAVWNTELGAEQTEGARRDGVAPGTTWVTETAASVDDIAAIRKGDKKSIYKWRYVSATEYATAGTAEGEGVKLVKFTQGSALGGGDLKTSENADGFDTAAYACYICEGGKLVEADAFYKARTNAYLQSYVEYYENEYGNVVTRTIAGSIASLDNALNQSFVQLVNDSSDDIQDGYVNGFTVSDAGVKIASGTEVPTKASWLYIDPSIGNDTNTNEISTTTGGWWYLVASEGKMSSPTGNAVKTVTDSVTDPKTNITGVNGHTAGSTFLRSGDVDGETGVASTDGARLNAQLFEIDPTKTLEEVVGKNGDKDVKKVVSVAFPFVNGTFALPGDALTNVFANAKISFQISFQAIQAFFPYTQSIDNIDYTNPLLGNAKALNIKNAIPIFNEAFDYQETYDNGGVDKVL